jgi:hypothetical protein
VGKWCTVTVTDSKGQRFSLDIRADSSFDAAHLYLTTAKTQPVGIDQPLPIPDASTVFEVVTDGKILHVAGHALKKWIVKRRGELGGPKGFLFSQRPVLD